MQIDVHEDKKLVCVWLTNNESADAAMDDKLKPLYEEYKQKKYTVAVYRSGGQDIAELTGALLRYNRKLFAEREVRAEKQGATLQM
ncbi:MAG: hypothetical protein IJ052_05020 [Oscillospiraceae bacterium]|nr:hypothetical protein [Oscillospiraceae bacterium]